MADEVVNKQIEAVEAKIAKVEDEIDEVKGQLKLVAQLEDPVLSEAKLTILAEREKGLRTKEHDLREEKKQLREKEKLLMAKQQQGAGCRSLPATILCARTLVACLLSCHAL